MKILVSHPHGNANTRSAVYGFYEKGLLYRYITSVAVFSSGLWHFVASLPGMKMFWRKTYDDKIKASTRCFPYKELGRQLSAKLSLKYFTKHEIGAFCTDKECEYIDKKTAIAVLKNPLNIDAVYCYEDVALHTFRKAKKLGKTCIYDLPIGHWRAMRVLLDEERKRNPEWAMTIGGFNDSDAKLERKDEELCLADKIYVASTFTKKSLDLFPERLADIEVIPYGFPPVNRNRVYTSSHNRKIKALYVGGLSQRKGISYVFEACEALSKHVELTVVGKGDVEGCAALKQEISKVNYISSLSHDKVLELMAESDVLLFPSLFEGFGLVITEAMSQGTPVITTDRTCGPDIITDGMDGWIVETGSAQPIIKVLNNIISEPAQLMSIGRAAMDTASKRPWSKYEAELAESVYNFLNGKLSKTKYIGRR
ncbi:MAG: glycosyltransferase family 4 protein [Bacteroidales bacterium]|nr:glycosyltransferase family 4 protein [Candidatus Minthousia equi]